LHAASALKYKYFTGLFVRKDCREVPKTKSLHYVPIFLKQKRQVQHANAAGVRGVPASFIKAPFLEEGLGMVDPTLFPR
jgi:hypothetical protein